MLLRVLTVWFKKECLKQFHIKRSSWKRKFRENLFGQKDQELVNRISYPHTNEAIVGPAVRPAWLAAANSTFARYISMARVASNPVGLHRFRPNFRTPQTPHQLFKIPLHSQTATRKFRSIARCQTNPDPTETPSTVCPLVPPMSNLGFYVPRLEGIYFCVFFCLFM